MSWWNPVSWYRNLFPPEADPVDAGFMVRGGKELRWPANAFSISVTTARDLHVGWDAPLCAALRAYEDVTMIKLRKPMFLGPVEAYDELAAIWADPLRRRGLTKCIHVQGGEASSAHGFSDIDFDTRTGEIRNVLVTVPRLPPSWANEMMVHELGHALGLEHDQPPHSIMAATLRPGTGQVLTAADAERLRRAYGPAPF